MMRKNAFFHADKKYHLEFKTLGVVQRHQMHLLLGLIHVVNRRVQSSIGQVVVQFEVALVFFLIADIRNYRFYDDNHLIVNAEYRWEVFAGLDMAAFFDAGKAAPKTSQINFHDLKTAAGFGFRFNGADSIIMRLDFGFSHEGYQFWLRLTNPF